MDIPAIAAKARQVLKDNHITVPFINVFDIANAEGIAVTYRNFPKESRDISGFYIPAEKTIYINVEDSAERQVFTIAHELGHHFLSHKTNQFGVYRRKNSYVGIKHENEREADCFAANLLMPEKMLKNELKNFPHLNRQGLTTSLLSLRFGVSSSAMVNRLKNLGYISR